MFGPREPDPGSGAGPRALPRTRRPHRARRNPQLLAARPALATNMPCHAHWRPAATKKATPDTSSPQPYTQSSPTSDGAVPPRPRLRRNVLCAHQCPPRTAAVRWQLPAKSSTVRHRVTKPPPVRRLLLRTPSLWVCPAGLDHEGSDAACRPVLTLGHGAGWLSSPNRSVKTNAPDHESTSVPGRGREARGRPVEPRNTAGPSGNETETSLHTAGDSSLRQSPKP